MHSFLKFILGLKLYMFRIVPLSIIRNISLYTQQWFMSYRYADSLRTGTGWNWSSILILLLPEYLYDTPLLLCVQWKLLLKDRGTIRNM
jgi:hypothetical protein